MQFGKVSRQMTAGALMALLASCSSTGDTLSGAAPAATPAANAGGLDTAQGVAVVEGTCPVVELRDQTSVYQQYAGRAKDDPAKLTVQASLADATRSCRMNETNLVVTVVAQGRVLAGPAGKPGTVSLPILVTASDGTSELYRQVSVVEASTAPDGSAGQFIFTNDQVAIPGGAGRFTKIFVGFDDGPVKKKKKG